MVTLTNNFGVEPDKDSIVMNVSEGTPNDAKSAQGQPKAILTCRRNSHPFQTRTLILNTPAKIGRSVARARPSPNNGIFDCKVLSRNHAIIWYEHDTGKFMIQDTKSSNGTFVNNQRLSKGGETSLPREFFSKDVVQFGVDVVENQRKGNEDSENSDENNHIVTHGCIVATVRLFHPNGKESKSGQPHSPPSPVTVVPHEKICKLELIVHEAQQREERLHDKLEELQVIIAKLEAACQEALTNRFEETRLLSKIESLEKQTKVMSKMMSGSGKCSEKVEAEIQQLLSDVEKVQSVAREIQERQHRKLLESEQKLVEAQRVASNLELEVIALREQASLTDSHLQDMSAKCRDYYQKIETLKSNFYAQLELTQKLEAQVAKFIEREVELELERELSHPNILEPKFILEEKSVLKKEKENQEPIEWCKNYEEMDKIEENDFISEDDKAEWLTKKLENLSLAMCSGLEHISNCIGQLVNSLVDVEKSRRNLEKLCIKKHELALQLDAAKMPVEENEKTEDELDGEKNDIMRSTVFSLSNEKITELESELKEQEEILSQERQRLKDSETKATKLKCELEATIKYCKKLNLNTSNLKALLRSHFKSLEDDASEYRQKIFKLEAEVEELENGHQLKLVEILRTNAKNVETEARQTQTSSSASVTVSTNTESEGVAVFAAALESNLCQSPNPAVGAISSKADVSNLDKSSSVERIEESFESVEKSQVEKFNPKRNQILNDLGVWEKMQKMQGLLSLHPSSASAFSQAEFYEMKNLLSLIAEDLVHLLLREQQMSKDKQSLQEKLDKSKSNVACSFGIVNQFVTLLLAVFLYYLGVIALQFFEVF